MDEGFTFGLVEKWGEGMAEMNKEEQYKCATRYKLLRK